MIGYRPGPDHYGAGAAESELQADVMRFVAILALCLVAISSLVESAANTPPVARTAAASVTAPEPDPAPPADDIDIERPVPIDHEPLPVAAPVSPTPPPSTAVPVADVGAATPSVTSAPRVATPRERPAAPVRQTPPATAPRAAARPATRPATPPVRPDRRGFTLRFETDAALLRLVSRGEASIFVFDGPQVMRLGFGPDGAQFTVAASPRTFHAIAPETVPELLRDALNRQGLAGKPVWGVTLPERSRRSLAELLRQHDHGTLTIDSRGGLRLEDEDDI